MTEGLTPYSSKAITLNGSQCLTQLSKIYTITRVRAANLLPCSFILIHWNQSRMKECY